MGVFFAEKDFMLKEKIQKNHKYWLIVSDPYDYTHPQYGKNRILGEVLDVNQERVIFKAQTSVKIAGIEGDVLILINRYKGDKIDELSTLAGVGLLYIDYNNYRAVNVKYVIIGSLEKFAK